LPLPEVDKGRDVCEDEGVALGEPELEVLEATLFCLALFMLELLIFPLVCALEEEVDDPLLLSLSFRPESDCTKDRMRFNPRLLSNAITYEAFLDTFHVSTLSCED